MINDYPNKYLVESPGDLPNLVGARDLYIDFETTSGDPKYFSSNPWRHCDILGICVTVDEDPRSFYIPLRHQLNLEQNIPVEPVYKWLRNLVRNGKRWINSNVKYDAHVGVLHAGLKISHLQLVDTVTLAKIINSDRFTYGLKELSKVWLHDDISIFENELKQYTHHPGGSVKNRDWACIPIYEMYKYGTQDALTARKLFKYLDKECPEECRDTWNTEIELTRRLFEIEQNGLQIDGQKLANDTANIPERLSRLEEKLLDITGRHFRPHVSTDCADLFCSHYNLPVLSWTDGGKSGNVKPQVDKDVLKAYKTYDRAPIEVIELVEKYRHFHQLHSTFTLPYVRKFDLKTQRVHGTFNQSVRTGRMSMSDPNMQQTSPDAKAYIRPADGYELVDFDLSQIEYRYVASYTENPQVLNEYRTNSNADFHQIMADLCGIARPPAKNMNFAVSFRAGKKKTISMLRSAFDREEVPEGISFDAYVESKGGEVFDLYHKRFPELKKEWWNAQVTCKTRGYARNIWGRRRHLTLKGSYMAFPNIIQSSAADLMKRITIRLQDAIKNNGSRLICIVHDSWLFEVPKEIKEEETERIKNIIEKTESRLKVPLYASAKSSSKNWKECD